MSVVTSFSLGLSLSMDAFAASIAQGAKAPRARLRDAIRIALFFGFFEAVFPVLGWALGLMIGSLMAQLDHWVAFILLLCVGLKMVRDGLTLAPENPNSKSAASVGRLSVMALATSIDAAAVGVTLVVLGIPIVQAAIIIGAVTFVLTCSGFLLGGMVTSTVPRYAEVLGGILLIAIGSKILLEHTLLS